MTPKERPILFSAPMVLAILAGRKTVTRRVVKPQPGDLDRPLQMPDGSWHVTDSQGGHMSPLGQRNDGACSYGAPGDRLWVREAWTKVPATAYRMSEGVHQTVNPADRDDAAIYAAGWDRSIPKWKPSIHMPRWASRILLEITDVKVERLQGISESEAIAEGLEWVVPGKWSVARHLPIIGDDPRQVYRQLWEHINGPEAWTANPWVWAVSFRRIDG